MTKIVFESHSTTLDNEQHLSSGHNNIKLSELGVRQAKELGVRYQGNYFDAIYCSDLIRSYQTAEIAFKHRFKIFKDSRLRECDYGILTQKPKELLAAHTHITAPFPGGESYTDAVKRMESFLCDLFNKLPNGRAMIIGHRATQYGLEHLINKKPLMDCVTAPWSWKPGWTYTLTNDILSK